MGFPLNRKKISILLGIEIQDVGRFCIYEDNQFNILMDTLVFNLQDDKIIQFMKTQEELYIYNLSSKDKPVIDFEVDSEDIVIQEQTDLKLPNSPFKIKSITEFWAGRDENNFLVGFILHGDAQISLLSICTETDEIELMDHDAFYERIRSLAFYYSTVITHWYDKA